MQDRAPQFAQASSGCCVPSRLGAPALPRPRRGQGIPGHGHPCRRGRCLVWEARFAGAALTSDAPVWRFFTAPEFLTQGCRPARIIGRELGSAASRHSFRELLHPAICGPPACGQIRTAADGTSMRPDHVRVPFRGCVHLIHVLYRSWLPRVPGCPPSKRPQRAVLRAPPLRLRGLSPARPRNRVVRWDRLTRQWRRNPGRPAGIGTSAGVRFPSLAYGHLREAESTVREPAGPWRGFRILKAMGCFRAAAFRRVRTATREVMQQARPSSAQTSRYVCTASPARWRARGKTSFRRARKNDSAFCRPHRADRARQPSVRKRARQVPPGRVAVRGRGADRIGPPA